MNQQNFEPLMSDEQYAKLEHKAWRNSELKIKTGVLIGVSSIVFSIVLVCPTILAVSILSFISVYLGIVQILVNKPNAD